MDKQRIKAFLRVYFTSEPLEYAKIFLYYKKTPVKSITLKAKKDYTEFTIYVNCKNDTNFGFYGLNSDNVCEVLNDLIEPISWDKLKSYSGFVIGPLESLEYMEEETPKEIKEKLFNLKETKSPWDEGDYGSGFRQGGIIENKKTEPMTTKESSHQALEERNQAIKKLNEVKYYPWVSVTPEMLVKDELQCQSFFVNSDSGVKIWITIAAYWSKMSSSVLYSLNYNYDKENKYSFEGLTEYRAKALLIGLGVNLLGGL